MSMREHICVLCGGLAGLLGPLLVDEGHKSGLVLGMASAVLCLVASKSALSRAERSRE